jgi:hypothetical protein
MSKLPEGRKPLPQEWFIDRANMMENGNMKQYAVMIDVDGDWMYVPANANMFYNHPAPKIFHNKRDAEEEASRWNTGVVVDYKTKAILPFTEEERKRAMERAKANSND